jgi:pyridoxamine 5'-phosphate oxidase
MPPLAADGLPADPLELFAAWFDRAADEAPLPEAVCLATIDGDGLPDARMVLLKGFGPEGFRFFTNEASAKGEQLAAAPRAALVFYWRELDRSVRVRGAVERVPAAEADAYFASRDRRSQLGAWASPQSRPLGSRADLDRRLAEAEARFREGEVRRPPNWGGYRVVPRTIEFWQGQMARLHDRFRYSREPSGAWSVTRLAP